MIDHTAYWTAVDAQLARSPAAPEVNVSPLRQTDYATVYEVKLSSVGSYRIFGFLSVPAGAGPFPALYLMPRYGSVNNVPHPADRRRHVTFQVMHRGQRLADQPFSAPYPGLLTMGINDPARYIYREIVADCLRGAEFLLSRPEVDKDRVGIRGDDLALIVAARRAGFAAADIGTLQFYRLMEARTRTDAYPTEEINDHLRTYPEQETAVAETFEYFDPQGHAGQVTAKTVLQVGDPGRIGGPEWLAHCARRLAVKSRNTGSPTRAPPTKIGWTPGCRASLVCSHTCGVLDGTTRQPTTEKEHPHDHHRFPGPRI